MRFAGDHAGDLRVPPESTHHGPAVPGHRYPRAVATGLCERAADATRPLCVRNWRTRSASAHVRRTAPCDGQRAVGKRPGDRLARLLLPPPRAGQGLLHRVLEGLADRHRFLIAGVLTAATCFGADTADEIESRRLADALYGRVDSVCRGVELLNIRAGTDPALARVAAQGPGHDAVVGALPTRRARARPAVAAHRHAGGSYVAGQPQGARPHRPAQATLSAPGLRSGGCCNLLRTPPPRG